MEHYSGVIRITKRDNVKRIQMLGKCKSDSASSKMIKYELALLLYGLVSLQG